MKSELDVSPTVIVAAGRVFCITTDNARAPRRMTVTVSRDYTQQWKFAEPGWRQLGYGVSTGDFFMWSARHLVSFPTEIGREPQVVESDEDILFAFATQVGWLLACETSVRLVKNQREISRVEFGEVVTEALLEDNGRLVIRDAAGKVRRLQISEAGLVAA